VGGGGVWWERGVTVPAGARGSRGWCGREDAGRAAIIAKGKAIEQYCCGGGVNRKIAVGSESSASAVVET